MNGRKRFLVLILKLPRDLIIKQNKHNTKILLVLINPDGV